MDPKKFTLENLFNVLISRTSSHIGEEFIEQFVRQIASFFEADVVLLGRLVDNKSIKTIFHLDNGSIKENFEYLLEGTPCQKVINGEFCLYPDKVADLFPEDAALVDMGIAAYIGTPFYLETTCPDSETCNCDADDVYGILVVLRKKPYAKMIDEAFLKTFFQAYANRLASELERIKYENKLKNLAHYDMLTNLHNKTYFVNTTKKFLATQSHNKRKGLKNKKHAMMFLDIDDFKDINDKVGHAEGDRCLVKIASVIKYIIRDDDMVSRFGGDEFVIFIRNMNALKDVTIVANKILAEIAKLCSESFGTAHFKITASIGIAVYPNDATTIEDLMVFADHAMYKAKRTGKNKFSYYSTNTNY